jgi:repressor LexA
MALARKNYRQEVLAFVESYMSNNGYPPTFEEIRESVGLSSKSHVDYYLGALEGDGLIQRTPHTPRGLRLTDSGPRTFEIAIEGDISAGLPMEEVDETSEPIELTPDIADPRRDLYALRVKGDSMVDDLVGDGDIIVCERCREVRRGKMAVVHLKPTNAVTVKRVFPEGKQLRLQPANPTMPEYSVFSRDAEIQGQVVAVIRRI